MVRQTVVLCDFGGCTREAEDTPWRVVGDGQYVELDLCSEHIAPLREYQSMGEGRRLLPVATRMTTRDGVTVDWLQSASRK